MVLKVTCPTCQRAYRLQPPYPPAGKRYRCVCGDVITVSYPSDLGDTLESVGVRPPVSADGARGEVSFQPGAAAPDDGLDLRPHHSEPGQPRPGHTPLPPGPLSDVEVHASRERAAEETRGISVTVVPQVITPSTRRPSQLETSPPPAPKEKVSTVGEVSSPPAPMVKPSARAEKSPPPPPAPVGAEAALGNHAAPITPGKSETVPPPPAGPTATSSPGKKKRPVWKYLLGLVLILGLVGAVAGALVLKDVSENLPSVDSLGNYQPSGVTRVYSSDGVVIGEFFDPDAYRELVQMEDIPQHVVDAFLSAEDAAFFEHSGIDYMGILRAAVINLQEGRMAQGASTITQQVARSFLLTTEKSFTRKIREILLAYRIEANFSKDHILYLYLNQIFFGEGAYGVQAASHIYFNKNVQDLSIAEAAILAGLPQAPTRYNPVRNWKSARERQTYVLRNMRENGKITPEQEQEALAQEITLVGRVDVNKGPWAAFTEHVRRYLIEKYGHEQVYQGAMRIETTLDTTLQEAAATAVLTGCRRTDHRMGWRGPLEQLPATEVETFLQARAEELRLREWKKIAGGEAKAGPQPTQIPPLKSGEQTKGVVSEVSRGYAVVRLTPELTAWLPIEKARWAYPVNPKRNWKGRLQDDLTNAFKVGDVVEVEVRDQDPEKIVKPPTELSTRPGFETWPMVALAQTPTVQAALLSYRMSDGAVVAMVGGRDPAESEFNRAFQAKRQTGSTFKPLVYSAALDHPEKHYTASTLVMDAPLAMVKDANAEEGAELWKPSNYAGDYMNEITFRKALILSRNTPTVRILDDIGVSYFYDYVVNKFGFESPLNKDLSMGLGSSSVTLLELSRAYSVFASGGTRVEPRFIERVFDRDGQVLEDLKGSSVRNPGISPQTAFIMTTLLQGVVCCGTGTPALAVGKLTAGKTGTTNEFRDAWYMGYTPELVTGVWTGFDDNTTLGYGMTGGDGVAPIWVEYMKVALEKYPDTDFKAPTKVHYVSVDSETGLLAGDGSDRVVRVAFEEGTEPTEKAPARGQVGTDDFFSTDGM